DRREDRRRCGDVEQSLYVAAELLLEIVNVCGETVERRLLVVAAGNVARAAREARPDVGVEIPAREFLDRVRRQHAKPVVGNRFAPKTDKVEVGRQQVVESKVIDRRDQAAGGKV